MKKHRKPIGKNIGYVVAPFWAPEFRAGNVCEVVVPGVLLEQMGKVKVAAILIPWGCGWEYGGFHKWDTSNIWRFNGFKDG